MQLKKRTLPVSDFESFHLALKFTLNQFANLLQKIVRNNNQPFMSKCLCKVIMKTSKSKSDFNKGIWLSTSISVTIVQIF